MKTTLFLLTLLSVLIAQPVAAQFTIRISTGESLRQDTIDQAIYVVQYDMQDRSDTTETEAPNETALLEVGRKLSKFYSYTKYVCDSVLAADLANHASQEVINEHLGRYGKSRLSEQTFKRFPDGKVTTLDEVAGGISRLRCEEDDERPQWELSADTMRVLSFGCRKATCRFKGRNWTAWYTTDIASSEGPWKLCGLPGLILLAEDDEGHYRFECTGIEQCRAYRPILYAGKDYEPMNRKAYNKVHERYYADPVGFITGNMPNVKITIKDSQGNPTSNPKNLPYNPLERE